MRSIFVITLITTTLFAGGYLYYSAMAICPTPIEYRIGEFDDRFAITRDEARLVIADAEAVWEDATGRNLFTYDPEAKFTINFVFDERQAYADTEQGFRDRLDQSANLNEEVRAQYQTLLDEFELLQARYETQRESFEAKRDAYNQRVAELEQADSVSEEEYAAVEADRVALNEQADAINALAAELQTLTDKINNIGSLGNQLVESYNRNVEVYNDTFTTGEAFTQGDYRGGSITIYKFSDRDELETVLAHELGHALSVGHVEGERSVMYYLMGEQPSDLQLSSHDLDEFVRICGTDDGVMSQLIRTLTLYVERLRSQLTTQ